MSHILKWCREHLQSLGRGVSRETFAHPYDPDWVIKLPHEGSGDNQHQQRAEVRALQEISDRHFAPKWWSEEVDGILVIHMERLTPIGEPYTLRPEGLLDWLNSFGVDGRQVGRAKDGTIKPYDMGFGFR